MEQFSGLWIPLITPFRDNSVDLPAVQQLAQHFVQAGCRGLVICGTTGEPASLSDEEKRSLIAAVREAIGPDRGLVMGLCGSDTRGVAADARQYSAAPVDGFLISAPYYVRPSQEGILMHFQEITRNTDKPIVLYNIPYRTGVNIALDTLQHLAENRQFVAIKESGSGNVDQLFDLIEQTPLKVLSGEDHMIFLAACMGGHGAIAAAAHVRPDLYVRVLDLVAQDKVKEARELFAQLVPWIRLLFSEPNPGPVKAALAMQGLIQPELRLPMRPPTLACREKLRSGLEAVMAIPSV